MLFCRGEPPLDLESACVRSIWATLAPTAFATLLIGVVILSRLPYPRFVRVAVGYIAQPFGTFLSLDEAEEYSKPESTDGVTTSTRADGSFLHAFLLSGVSILETISWITLGTLGLVHRRYEWDTWRCWAMIIPWSYASILPLVRRPATPPFDLFWLFLLLLVSSILVFGGKLYDNYVSGLPLPSTLPFTAYVFNLLGIVFGLGVICSMPIGIPSKSVEKEKIGFEISPEDYAPLWKWITFEWVYPLIRRGTNTTLNEPDIWALSPTNQSRPVFYKFNTIIRSSLLRRLWAANSLDLLLDFSLTFLSVTFNYLSPVFLKRILDALDADVPTNKTISQAYIFAFLTFLASVCKAQADVQHLWFGRRACTRLRSELMASIYEKALKRKDFSGIVEGKDKKGEGKDKGKEKTDGGKDDANKSGADIGKIVQLMSSDANRVAMLISGIYFLYSAPFEIMFALILLYRMLGVSAFAGAAVLLVASPLNHFLAKRSMRIQKGLLAVRDKRMGILNEVIASVKFIKYFAWEGKWINRVEEARKNELKWLLKSRLNYILFSLLWALAPMFVAIASFTSYVLLGNELTISVAFTSIALFQMLRAPLNVIPSWIVVVLQTKISLDRIETFLHEPEVDDEISGLKKPLTPPATSEFEDQIAPLGIENGSFGWNAVEKPKEEPEKDKKKKKGGKKDSKPEEEPTTPTTTDREEVRFELRDVSVVFPQDKLTVVTGPTASGKSALFMALLGEMTPLPGSQGRLLVDKNPLKISAHGHGQYLSYAAQTPWLQHSSIQDNILFGQPLDPKRYDEVLECCALKPDLAIFEDGDKTEIGARGVSLSGGQKARVALARAVYTRSQYVLLDDPLSAVDSHTARFLYERLLKGPLLANRTVILITHHVDLVLPGTHYLVRMLDGRIDLQGVVEELEASGQLDRITRDATFHMKAEEALEDLKKPTADDTAREVDSAPVDEVKPLKPRKLVQDEQREEGAVKWGVYNIYLKASSYWTWAILLFLVLASQGNTVIEKLWIKVWGEAYKDAHTLLPTFALTTVGIHSELDATFQILLASIVRMPDFVNSPRVSYNEEMSAVWNRPSPMEHPMFYVAIYTAIGIGTSLISVISSGVQLSGALRASRLLFTRLLNSVMFATVRFHDTTPAGRLLNRFSKDVETIDTSLASSLQQVNSSLATFFASLIIVSVVFPWFLLPAVVIGYVYVKLGLGYLNTGRDLRRMESNSRSPIFSGFAELLDGIVTVRAFSAERRFLNTLFSKIDLTTQMWYTFWMTNRWLLLHYDFLGALAVFITTLMALSGRVPAGYAGLTITSAMAFTSSIYWACRFWTQLELDLNSVERIAEYLALPQEPSAVIESQRPPAYWPSSSNEHDMLVVQDLVIKYAPELPAVLHDVSFALKGRERVGLLGRTGSGKSTLATSLMRFVDPTAGVILIDGIDITKIGLNDLRSRMTFIPQDATLFSGSIRDNLDPFGEYTDAECLDVLYRVQMLSHSAYTSRRSSRAPSIHEGEEGRNESPSGSSTIIAPSTDEEDERVTVTLDTKVSVGGTNFSQGQRQLLALGRALLRQSSLIIMDEATSSIDFKTDAKIQATIREEFKNSLLITVAHRLKTVIDYDRLLVLDQGRVVEFDTPYNLIQKEDGLFRNMCLNSGAFKDLEGAAKKKAEESK